MSDIVISVNNLSKQYRLGVVGTGTLSHDLNRWWAHLRGKEDPTLAITESNIRTHSGHSDFIWALKDMNFNVKRGEVLGIIGANGAGKSTLLKILSRVTAPTTGSVKIKGRIASLLEVGTGFHPELTGRENIYLNGAIMGMTREEVSAKLDQIIDFSGCELYVDTPVKRYSSGMTVRLGFAVAAHLEPEILVVDEVLAVGDIEFQKKCIGKMKDAAGDGRTVLFVSHNMTAVEGLCPLCMYIKEGRVIRIGETSSIINEYLDDSDGNEISTTEYSDDQGKGYTLLPRKTGEFRIKAGEKIRFNYVVNCPTPVKNATTGITIYDGMGRAVVGMSSKFQGIYGKGKEKAWYFVCDMGCINLSPGDYKLKIYLGEGVRDLATFSKLPNLRVTANSKLFEIDSGIPPNWGAFYWKPKWHIKADEINS